MIIGTRKRGRCQLIFVSVIILTTTLVLLFVLNRIDVWVSIFLIGRGGIWLFARFFVCFFYSWFWVDFLLSLTRREFVREHSIPFSLELIRFSAARCQHIRCFLNRLVSITKRIDPILDPVFLVAYVLNNSSFYRLSPIKISKKCEIR